MAEEQRAKYDLPKPSPMPLGTIQIVPFTGSGTITKYVAWCASVLNDKTSPETIEKIGQQAGMFTRNKPEVRLVEAPLLGTGYGRLSVEHSALALAKGFRAVAHEEATLIIYCLHGNIVETIRKAFDDVRIASREVGDKTLVPSFTDESGYLFAGDSRSKNVPPNQEEKEGNVKITLSASASGIASESIESEAREKYKRRVVRKSGILGMLLGHRLETEQASGHRRIGEKKSRTRTWAVGTVVTVVVVVAVLASIWKVWQKRGPEQSGQGSVTASTNGVPRQDNALDSKPVTNASLPSNVTKPAPSPPNDWNEPQWATARGNIHWVFEDQGAHQNYMAHLGSGKFNALLTAQSHNKGSYQSISDFGPERTDLYLKSIGQ
jgi:hypothetical protein